MSIKVMTEIWEHAPCMGTDLLILLALGDSANDERGCWPGLRSIAKKGRVQFRQCIKVIQDLELQGFIDVQHRKDERRNNLSNHYYIRKVEDWLLLWAYEATNPSVPQDTTPSATGNTRVVLQGTLGVLHSEGENVTEPSYEPKIEPKSRKSKLPPEVIFRNEWKQYALMGNELLKAFGNDFVDTDHQTTAALTPYLEVAKELTTAGCKWDDISKLSAYIAKRAKTEEWSKYSVKTFSRYYTDFLKAQRQVAPKVWDDPAMDLNIPQPIVPILIREAKNNG